MRLFIAVNFNDEVKKQIIIAQNQLREQSIKGNFTGTANLHLTLAFLGETKEEKIDGLLGIINEIKSEPFEVSFNNTGCFTHSRKELWWIGADKNSPGLQLLKAIHLQLITSLSALGFTVDNRPFNAHITLGREIRHSGPINLNPLEIIVKVGRISLMKSEHLRGLLTYTEISGKNLS
jgi:2'-5' RNA ligase